jgi:ketosteroid isomerase-like protein
MNPRRVLLSLMTLLLLAIAAIKTLPAQTSANSEKEIAEIREQWVANWNAKKLEPIVQLYAQDAVFLPSTGQRIEGREAIGNYLKQVMDSSYGKLSVKSLVSENSGKLAFDSGSFEDALKGGGATIGGNATVSGHGSIGGGGQRQVKGSYLIVLKRGTGSKWFIQQHASTEASPAVNK